MHILAMLWTLLITAEGTDIPQEILGSDLVINVNASKDFDT